MKSCVSLLSAVCGQPETVMEHWLDLYYQVRRTQEKADAAARAAERLKEMAQLEAVLEPFQSAALITSEEPGEQMAPASAVNDEAAAEPEAKPEPEPLRENRIKRPGGKGKSRPSSIGNTRGHDAAVFKRQVRDRLEALRKKGVSAPEIVKAAPDGSVKESDLYMILQGHVIKIDIYRALDEALRHFEN